MNTPCDFEARLTAYLLGDLPPGEASAVRRHLEQCGTCRRAEAELKPLLTVLSSALAASPADAPRLHPARRRRVLATRPPARRSFGWVFTPWPLLRLAASLIVVGGLTFLTVRHVGCRTEEGRRLGLDLSSGDRVAYSCELAEPETRDVGEAASVGGRVDRTFDLQDAETDGVAAPAAQAAAADIPVPCTAPAAPEPRAAASGPVSEVPTARGLAAGNRDGASKASTPRPTDPARADRYSLRDARPSNAPVSGKPGEDRAGVEFEERASPLRAAGATEQPGMLAALERPAEEKRALDKLEAAPASAPPVPAEPPARSRHARVGGNGGDATVSLGYARMPEKQKTDHVRNTFDADGDTSLPLGGEMRKELSADESLKGVKQETTVMGSMQALSDVRSPPAPARPRLSTDAPAVAHADATRESRQKANASPADETRRKLDSVTIPELDLRQANVKDVLAYFESASRAFAPAGGAGGGVQFEAHGLPGGEKAQAAEDPFAGQPRAADAFGAPPITFSARHVTLGDALKTVTDVAGLKYRVAEDGKVQVMPGNALLEEDLITRTYTVDNQLATAARQAQQRASGEAAKTGEVLNWEMLLRENGVQPAEGSSIHYDPEAGELRVTDTAEGLRTVDSVLEQVKRSAAPVEPAAHNPFIETRANPFSTFAIDVDTASYTLTRQALLAGQLPEPERVRTEEIVNAFDYGDAAPDRDTFRIYLEGAPSPFGHGLTLLRIGVKGRRLGREEQRPAMLTFLIDTSGSMNQPDRIGLARRAFELLLGQLAEQDRIQVVAYGDHARLVLPPTPASERNALRAAFHALQCTGSTNLEEGMRQAYAQAASAFVPGAENRVILVSDGVANLGSGSAADILGQIDAYRRQGITCSVFGVGRGAYNDALLEQLANRGDGTYRFLDSEEAVRQAFVDDLAATLNTIAADVKIQVEWRPASVRRYRQLGYENRSLTREQFRDDAVDAGEVGSGQAVTALYELERNPEAQREPLGTVRVRYRRIDTGAVEEIAEPITSACITSAIDKSSPGLRLAAAAAEFAEILRRSPHAAGSSPADVARLLHPVALELRLDTRVSELLRLTEAASGLK